MLATVGLVACEGVEPPPDNPTWVDDVEPILRGNCFHCHGEPADALAQGMSEERPNRWDVHDLTLFQEFGPFPMSFNSARTHATIIKLYAVDMPAMDLPTRMPPPPALPLSARDRQVLNRWSATGAPAGMRTPNHPPTVRWLERPRTFVVEDADHDQVLGKLVCGTQEWPIRRTGGHAVPAGAALPCEAQVRDQWSPTARLPLP